MIPAVYIHTPYCQHICHYCDFAKTANYSNDHLQSYAQTLRLHIDQWIDRLTKLGHWSGNIQSVYLGGGTPGLMQDELQTFLQVLQPYFNAQTEVTLETNPNLCDPARLSQWARQGINRLSIGVQSFDPEGLKKLHRDHSAEAALVAIQDAKACFSSINLDLIYGWPGQSMESWEKDLDLALNSGINHLSAYALTFTEGTPIGRAYHRGRLSDVPDDDQVSDFYQTLCKRMRDAGWIHYEVSNWARSPESMSKHNLSYWTGDYYLGVGTGAHGYLPLKDNPIGMRYSYSKNDRKFFTATLEELINIESDRTPQAWLVEIVGNGLRQAKGIDLHKIRMTSAFEFKPDAFIQESIDKGHILVRDDRLYLDESMWFLEMQWAHKILACFHRAKSD